MPGEQGGRHSRLEHRHFGCTCFLSFAGALATARTAWEAEEQQQQQAAAASPSLLRGLHYGDMDSTSCHACISGDASPVPPSARTRLRSVAAIHGDMDQHTRMTTLHDFKAGEAAKLGHSGQHRMCRHCIASCERHACLGTGITHCAGRKHTADQARCFLARSPFAAPQASSMRWWPLMWRHAAWTSSPSKRCGGIGLTALVVV